MKLRKSIRKKILYGIAVSLLVLFIWNFNLIIYGIRQGIGQLHIVWNAQTFEDFLAKSQYPDSTKVFYKKKLDLIREIRKFAIDSLGLRNSSNYSKIFDQKDMPLLWAVSACEPFELKPKLWNYGFLGDMPYKGFFDSTRAYHLAKELEKEGLDVQIYTPAGWSTLGWFSDPVLSSMLHWSEGDLASLIIHELTHSTIWIKGDVEYNENLADFVGDQGASLFLKSKYGTNSATYLAYETGKKSNEQFFQFMLRGASQLDSLYKSFKKTDSKDFKLQKKKEMIQKIVQSVESLSKNKKRNRRTKKGNSWQPNNAYFMSYRRYRAKQNQFEKEFKNQFQSNFSRYLAYLKSKYAL